MTKISNMGFYFHVPFCLHRCDYCDFNTYAGMGKFIPEYMNALRDEIEHTRNDIHDLLSIESLYFGGGTPSLIPLEEYIDLFRVIQQNFTILAKAEITIEVNPGTVNERYLVGLIELGINRLSIGMQSAHLKELKLLRRIHTLRETTNTIRWAKQAGFDNLNLDLLYGLPDQNISDWQISLETALEFYPQHLSLYSLSLNDHSIMAKKIQQKQIHPINDDFAADCYEFAMDFLEKYGFKQYEISNWYDVTNKEKDYRSHHNLRYWRNQPYLGFGAGAHSFYNHTRWENLPNIEEYIQESKKKNAFPTRINKVKLKKKDEMEETMMLGLRLTIEGISDHVFKKRFNVSMSEVFGKEIQGLLNLGLLEWSCDSQKKLRLTRRGRLLGNQVFMKFV